MELLKVAVEAPKGEGVQGWSPGRSKFSDKLGQTDGQRLVGRNAGVARPSVRSSVCSVRAPNS